MNKALRTRQFIIEKTAAVFNAKGFSGTSMQDLTEVTGLTKGSIYGNFKNKDEVAAAAFDFSFGQVVAYLRSKIAAQHKSIDQLLVYPSVYRSFLDIPFLSTGCPLMNTAVEADDTHPMLRERASNALAFWKKSIVRIIQDGIINKEIKPDINPQNFAMIMMSLIEGSVMQAKLTGNPESLQVTMNFLEKEIKKLKV